VSATLTSTSNCIHEEEGKYIITHINRYQIFATYPTMAVYHKGFFHAFMQAKLSTSFFAIYNGRNP